MSRRRCAALWAAVLLTGAVGGALYGLVELLRMVDAAEQELGR